MKLLTYKWYVRKNWTDGNRIEKREKFQAFIRKMFVSEKNFGFRK